MKKRLSPKPPAYAIMVKLNNENYAPYQITDYLKEHGFLTLRGKYYTDARVWEYLRTSGNPAKNRDKRPEKEVKEYAKHVPDIPPVEKPSILQRALLALNDNFKLEDDGYYLWIGSRWVPSKLCDVMKAANRKLVETGKQQIDINPNWVVK